MPQQRTAQQQQHQKQVIEPHNVANLKLQYETHSAIRSESRPMRDVSDSCIDRNNPPNILCVTLLKDSLGNGDTKLKGMQEVCCCRVVVVLLALSDTKDRRTSQTRKQLLQYFILMLRTWN